MESPKLAALVGVGGGVVVISGVVMVGVAIALGLAAALPQVPLAAWIALVGILMVLGGAALADHGGTKTVETVQNELSMPKVFANFPWTFVAVGGFAALLLYGVFRRRRRSAPETARTVVVTEPAPQQEAPAKKSRMTLLDVFAPLATQAAASAATVGLSALGVPSLKDLAAELLRPLTEKSGSKEPSTTEASSRTRWPERTHNGRH